ncbi:MAG: exodeoxyribonuclease VII large subunit [Deltaproteobacteria bacterium]|nr:exodeoxyribonuclease VII large subunit [Deltaproteobacteria bacterium]
MAHSKNPGSNQNNFPANSRGHIYTVSTFTSEIKDILESTYPFIWIKGEVSNFKKAVSGHYYFTLKDDLAQINAVMFRNQNRQLKFEPEDGFVLIGFGRLSLYEPRGTYQVIFEYLEPDGKGALVAAFEQLKARLADEGLFKDKFKKPLPFLPKKISIITSPTGAVVHDLIAIITRRYPNIRIEIVPSKVQGHESEDEIVSGLELINSRYAVHNASDIIILARGGGSIEDMHAFNSEKVARAVFESKIPVMSAIGHETDYTIIDFVADMRAPTPSAAGEIVVPVKDDLVSKCNEEFKYLNKVFLNYLQAINNQWKHISKRLFNQERKISDLRLKIEDLFVRLNRVTVYIIQKNKDTLRVQSKVLLKNNPISYAMMLKDKLKQRKSNLLYFITKLIDQKTSNLNGYVSILTALNPTSILDRGYSITRTIKGQTVVRDSKIVHKGQELEIILAKGKLTVKNI